jgi:hypothetical protein
VIRSGEGNGRGDGRAREGREKDGGEAAAGLCASARRPPLTLPPPTPAASPRPAPAAPAPTAVRGARGLPRRRPEPRASASRARSPARAEGGARGPGRGRGPGKPTPGGRAEGSHRRRAVALASIPGRCRPRPSVRAFELLLEKPGAPRAGECPRRGRGGGRLRAPDISGIPDAAPEAGMPLRPPP